jgi:cytochrome c oxidase cbb3-type subunit 3
MKTKKIAFTTVAGMLLAFPALAQSIGQSQQTLLVSVIWGLIILLIFLTLGVLISVWQLYYKFNSQMQPLKQEEKLSFWEKAMGLKPLSAEKSLIIEGEDFDGIKELNNPIPAWFNVLFYGTILIGVVYMIIYHVSYSWPLSAEEYNEEVRIAAIQRQEYLEKNANSIDETNVQMASLEAELEKGKGVFNANCVACHGKLGEGGVGPNLTDEYWLHGGDIKSVFKLVKYGVPEKGMIPWKDKLKPEDIRLVSSYILTLQGTNPPNGKAPQGEKFVAKN